MSHPRNLKRNLHGDDVRALKQSLMAAGYPLDADDEFDNDTYQAVLKFQRAHHLAVDGIVGKHTFAALDALSVKKETVPTPSAKPESGEFNFQDLLQQITKHIPELGAIIELFKNPEGGEKLGNDLSEGLNGIFDLFKKPAAVSTTPMGDRPLIVIDPGHGHYIGEDGKKRHDPGALGKLPKGVTEDDITNAVSLKLKATLEAKGFAVQLTRDEDDVLASRFDARGHTGKGQKVCHISIHADAGAASSSGLRMYTHPTAGSNSREFAQALSNPNCDTVTNSKRMGMLNPSHMGNVRAALAEVGNLNNAADVARLTSEGGQQAIADILADRIASYYSNSMCVADAKLPKLSTQPQQEGDFLAQINQLFSGFGAAKEGRST